MPRTTRAMLSEDSASTNVLRSSMLRIVLQPVQRTPEKFG
jgi:hypothetical protein